MRTDVAIAIALLLLGGAVHLQLVDFFLHRVHAEGIAERTDAQYREQRETVRTLVLGNSHAKWGLAAEELDGGFNLAIGGQTAPETYYVLEGVLADPPPRLTTLILPADALMFSDWQDGAFGLRHWYAPRVDYLAIGRLRGQPLLYAVNGWIGRHAPYVGRRSEILLHLGPGLHKPHPLVRGSPISRWSWAEETPAERERRARNRVALHFPRPEFDEVAGLYYARILARAREAGLRVLLVRFPVSPEYMQASRAFRESARTDERLEEMLGEFPEVALRDARLDFFDKPELFIDADHLNQAGAVRLTRSLRRMLEGRPEGGARR